MAKSYRKSPSPSRQGNQPAVKEGYTPTEFVDRDLTGVNPLSQQFEPTDADPVRQHYRMAGGCK